MTSLTLVYVISIAKQHDFVNACICDQIIETVNYLVTLMYRSVFVLHNI